MRVLIFPGWDFCAVHRVTGRSTKQPLTHESEALVGEVVLLVLPARGAGQESGVPGYQRANQSHVFFLKFIFNIHPVDNMIQY